MLGTAKSDLSCSSCSTIAVGLLSGQALTEGPQSLQLFCEGFCLGLGTKYGVVQGAVLCKMIRCLSFDCIPWRLRARPDLSLHTWWLLCPGISLHAYYLSSCIAFQKQDIFFPEKEWNRYLFYENKHDFSVCVLRRNKRAAANSQASDSISYLKQLCWCLQPAMCSFQQLHGINRSHSLLSLN